MIPTRVLLALALALALGLTPADARPGQALSPPEAKDIALDGKPDEAAWKSAPRLPFPAIEVPTPAGMQKLTPDVRVLSVDGRLVIAVTCAEDPGTAIGLHLKCAPASAKSAAEGVTIDFRPVELRAKRFHALGPKGVGRAKYRVEGAAEWKREGTWSLELGVPWADLATKTDEVLRLALVVHTRTPNVHAAWPAGAVWRGPKSWNEVVPPKAGWPLDVTVDAERLAKEDTADAARMVAWIEFQKGVSTPILPTIPREQVLARFEKQVTEPLEDVMAARPDLAVPVRCILGDAYHRLGLWKRAGDTYHAALRAAPGWREAQYGLHVKVLGQRYAEGALGASSDYAAAFRRLTDAAAARDASPWPQEGVRLGRALLHYKRGAFDEAIPVLKALAKRYAFDPFLDAHARFAEAGLRAQREQKNLAEREGNVVRPKAQIETTKGTFTIELFADDASLENTIKNFVYLAQKKFYDGLAFHRSVPFFLVQTGDPNSRKGAEAADEVGTGTPGYAIRSVAGKRRMLRGAVVMATAGQDSEGSQFYVLTGTAMHLQGQQTVFGRVIEGQDVVDALAQGSRVVKIALRDLDPKWRYVPITVAGTEPSVGEKK